jgi:hypothetical protein
MPEAVRSRLLSLFTEPMSGGPSGSSSSNSKYVASARKKDLMVAYILVLAMASNDYRPLVVNLLASDLQITVPKYAVCVCVCV